MKKLILISILLGQSIAFGIDGLFQVNETKVEADLQCYFFGKNKGLGIAAPRADHDGRIWNIKKGEELGLEHEVIKLQIGSCPGCMTFESKLMGVTLRGEMNNLKLILKGVDEDGREMEIGTSQCIPPIIL